jgi:electron transport complex protein RnfC
MPARIENTFEKNALAEAGEQAAGEQMAGRAFGNQKSRIEGPGIMPAPFHHLPQHRRDLAALLEELGIRRTSAVVPSLAEQLRHLGGGGAGGGEGRPRALVVNLLPAQPEFALGAALTRLALEDLRMGVHALHHILRPRNLLIVFDRHDRETRRAWRRVARQRLFPLELRPVLNRYPQAHPTILMRTLWGKRLQVDALPSRFNRVMIDPVTPWALGRYLRTKQPFTDRPVQLFVEERGTRTANRAAEDGRGVGGAGREGAGARLLMAHVGETVAACCARYHVEPGRRQVLINGMLAGVEGTADSVIDAATESISLREPVEAETPSACLSCGWCVDVCPTALTPVRLMELNGRVPSGIETGPGAAMPVLAGGDGRVLRLTQARESLHCIGCGLCSYVCPTRLPLTQEIVALRTRVAAAAPGKSRGSA